MNPRELVRTRHPGAEARQHGGRWAVQTPGFGARLLGEGQTEEEAWVAAAAAVQADREPESAAGD